MEAKIPTPLQVNTWATITDHLTLSESERPDVDLADVKTLLNALGVNQRGWRLLVDYWGTLMAPIRGSLICKDRPLSSLENLCIYLRLLQRCEMDVIPPPDFVSAWANMTYPDLTTHLNDVPVGLFRAAWKERVRLQNSEAATQSFLKEEMPAVVKWFFTTNQMMILDEGELKRGWKYLRDRYQAWHSRCYHVFTESKDWEPLLGSRHIIGCVAVVELVSANAITEEGMMMRHCVAQCIPGCVQGEYRVFSLRMPGTEERLATLGLEKSGGQWTIEDLRMQDDDDPTPQLVDVADAVEVMCRKAESKRWQEGEGVITERLFTLFRAAFERGDTAFADAAPRVLAEMRDLRLPRALRLEDLQAVYVSIIRRYVDNPLVEKLAMLDVESLFDIKLDDSEASNQLSMGL